VFKGLPKKDAWLKTGDDSSHAWWDHSGAPGHKALRSVLPSKLKISYAPGWGSLLPTSKLGVDAGLQCPMCNDSAGRKTQLVASKIVSSTY